MAQAIKTIVYGIKCDNPACGCVKSVPYKTYPQHIKNHAPCCGSTLLTERDYLTTKFLVDAASVFNKIEVPEETVDAYMSVELNGTNK